MSASCAKRLPLQQPHLLAGCSVYAVFCLLSTTTKKGIWFWYPWVWFTGRERDIHSCLEVVFVGSLLYRVSLARGPKLLSMYTAEQGGFLIRKYLQTGSFKACQTAFRTEFGDKRAPSKCCIQKWVKKLETRGSRSNACRLLSLEHIEGQSVQKYTAHNRTTQRRYVPRDSSRQRRHFGKIIPEFG